MPKIITHLSHKFTRFISHLKTAQLSDLVFGIIIGGVAGVTASRLFYILASLLFWREGSSETVVWLVNMLSWLLAFCVFICVVNAFLGSPSSTNQLKKFKSNLKTAQSGDLLIGTILGGVVGFVVWRFIAVIASECLHSGLEPLSGGSWNFILIRVFDLISFVLGFYVFLRVFNRFLAFRSPQNRG